MLVEPTKICEEKYGILEYLNNSIGHAKKE